MKNTIKIISFLLFTSFLLNAGIVFCQSDFIESIENDKLIDSLVGKYLIVTESFFVDSNNNIVDLQKVWDEKNLNLVFMPIEKTDSLNVFYGNLPDKIILVGTMKYNHTRKSLDDRQDVYYGNSLSFYNHKKLQHNDFLIGKIPGSKEKYNKQYYTFWVIFDETTTLQLNFY